MIERDGEQYLLGNEAALYLGISRGSFYHNVWPNLARHHLPGRKHTYYKLSDLRQMNEVQVVKLANVAHFFAEFHSDCEQEEGGTSYVPGNTTSY